MQFIDLKSQQKLIRKQIDENIKKVLDHGQYILGPEVGELEERLADFVGVKHCIGVSSGTDALLIAMMALDIKAGDEVITTPFTFIATGEMISLIGAKPVFVDIDPKTYNIDPEKIATAITSKTKAIIPVSLYGQCADFKRINEIAEKHQIPVIEDGAQSLGATHYEKQSCSLSTIGCTSFFPSKPLGAYGDAGACFTDDDLLAKKMHEIRAHGQDRRYHHPIIGINGRIDTIQAAILLAKLDLFVDEVLLRQNVASEYVTLFAKQGGGDVISPYLESYNTSVYAQFTLQIDNRDRVLEKLKEKNIPTAVHYPVPLTLQPAFKDVQTSCPISEALSQRVFSLPMHPYLSSNDQEQIVQEVLKASSL